MPKVKKKTLTTNNINETIKKFAISNTSKISDCDFNIDEIETHICDISGSDFRLFNEDIKEQYRDEDKIINEHIEFSQNYKITIFVNKTKKIKLKYKIEFSELSTHPKIIISPDSYIPFDLYSPKILFALAFKELNKIKAQHNIILNIFDVSMIEELKKFIKLIYAKKFKRKVKISLFDGIIPNKVQKSRLALRYLQKEKHNQVILVEENEVIAEFYKAKFGKNGLNCYGQIIDGGFGDNKENPIKEYDDDSIKIYENEDKKQYISKIKGYVHYYNNKISVDNKIKMHTLTRNQETISSDEDNNIEVIVAQYDSTKDSVGEGVELVSESIHINGHIGANSIIEAHTLKIDGATHQDSTQFAKYAEINRHKGTLRCNEAKIKLLEGGVIHATSVTIDTCLGGSIYAQDVNIGHVKNNLKIYASNSINIKLMSGETNKLCINYKKVPILVSKIELIEEDIEELMFSLQEALRHDFAMVNTIQSNIDTLKKEMTDIQNSVYHAKISITEPINGVNKIIFTINDNSKISLQTDSIKYSPFYLKVDENKITLHPTLQTIKINS